MIYFCINTLIPVKLQLSARYVLEHIEKTSTEHEREHRAPNFARARAQSTESLIIAVLLLMGLIIEKINLYQFKNFIRELNEPRLSNEMPSNYLLIGNNLCNNSNELAFRDNVKGYPYNIAPNIVHYILFSIPEIRFSKFMSLLSVLRNQKPDQIIIHCDCDHLNGEYYKLILKIIPKTRTILTIRQIEKPTKIFFRNLNKKWLNWHSADVTRTKLLLEFGSIYIDQDVYVVQNLDKFMKYEMTLSLNVMELMSNGIFIAHKNSRFLRLYLDLYRNYDSNE